METDDQKRRLRWYEELCDLFDDVPNAWHIGRRHPALTDVEIQAVYDFLVTALGAHGQEGFGKDCDFFVVDQFFGDRTHKIEVMQPARLSWCLINEVQDGLRKHSPLWRIIIVCERMPDTPGIWIHPDQVTCQDALSEVSTSSTPAEFLELWKANGPRFTR